MRYGTDVVFQYIGARIAYYRILSGFSMKELADSAKISQLTLKKIEAGTYQHKLGMNHLVAIADALHVNCRTLLELNEKDARYAVSMSAILNERRKVR